MGMLALQDTFAGKAAMLIQKARSMGYKVSLGDAYRDSRCAYGSPKTKHRVRLAIDLNLFKDNIYLDSTEDHRALGEWWESIGGVWGGRFTPEDGNHYQSPDDITSWK